MKTSFETKEEALAKRSWKLIDAEGQVVGRLATKAASLLRGKYNPRFTPHNDCGDFVVVINADKAVFSGNKKEDKLYRHHSGYIGGLKTKTASDIFETNPEDVIKKAVKGMLSKTALGKKQFAKLKVYRGDSHPHAAQQLQQVTIKR